MPIWSSYGASISPILCTFLHQKTNCDSAMLRTVRCIIYVYMVTSSNLSISENGYTVVYIYCTYMHADRSVAYLCILVPLSSIFNKIIISRLKRIGNMLSGRQPIFTTAWRMVRPRMRGHLMKEVMSIIMVACMENVLISLFFLPFYFWNCDWCTCNYIHIDYFSLLSVFVVESCSDYYLII